MKGACFRISTRLFLRPSLQPLLSPTRASPAFSSRFVSSKSCNMVKVDEELLSGYGPANYCPLQPNSVLDDSYTAVVKLGYGRTSTTWLCTDCQDAYKVLKVGAADVTKREKSTLENFATATLHTEDPGSICVRQPERIFSHFVEGQAYNCFVFEPLGPNLLEFTKQNRPFGSQRARKAATYILLGLRSLHATGFAHTDLKLDNIQITLPDQQKTYLDSFCAEEKSSPSFSKLSRNDMWIVASREMKQDEFGYPILCDLGSAIHTDEKYGGPVQAIPYRAPEVILGAEWDQKIDIWSFGVLMWEMLFAERLFGETLEPLESSSVGLMIQYLGAPSKSFLDRCKKAGTYFDEDGKWKHGVVDIVGLEGRIEEGTSIPALLDFIGCALRWDPRERLSAADLLDHDWLK